MTTGSVFQPPLLGSLHLFERAARSDVVCLLRNVQMSAKSVGGVTGQAHMRLRGDGPVEWVGVKPVHRMRPICSTEVRQANWDRLVTEIRQRYQTAPHWDAVTPMVARIARGGRLGEVSTDLFRMGLAGLGLEPAITYDDGTRGSKSDLVLSVLLRDRVDTYVSGGFGRLYLDLEEFESAGVSVVFQDWECPTYEQGSQPFVADLCLLDAVACLGWPGARELLA